MREPLKKLIALGIGMLLSLGLLALLEGALRLNKANAHIDLRGLAFSMDKSSARLEKRWDGVDRKFLAKISNRFRDIEEKYGPRALNEHLPFSNKPSPDKNFSYRMAKHAPDGETIFDISYRYNEKQRRPTPGQPKNSETSIFLVGCSYVVGEGVGEDETMAAYMQMGLGNAAVESMAFHGWGVNNHLNVLRGENTHPERPNPYVALEKKPVIVVYIFIPAHIYRTTCPLFCYQGDNQWMLTLPNYATNEQFDAEYLGSFLDSRYFSTGLNWLADSAIVTQLGLDWPIPGSTGELDRFFGVLNAYRKELGKKVPIKDFYFVPVEPYFPFGERVGTVAEANGYKVLDLGKLALPEMTGRNPRIPFDGHFTPAVNYLLSRLILSRIQKDHPDIH